MLKFYWLQRILLAFLRACCWSWTGTMPVARSGHKPGPESPFAAAPASQTWCSGRDCGGRGVPPASTRELEKGEKGQRLNKLIQLDTVNNHA